MSKYQFAYQCDECKKIYSSRKFTWTDSLFLYGLCPKCGCKGMIYKVIAKRKLFGWKVKEEK